MNVDEAYDNVVLCAKAVARGSPGALDRLDQALHGLDRAEHDERFEAACSCGWRGPPSGLEGHRLGPPHQKLSDPPQMIHYISDGRVKLHDKIEARIQEIAKDLIMRALRTSTFQFKEPNHDRND